MELDFVDYFDGSWKKVERSNFEGVSNLENVDEIYEEGERIRVVYNTLEEVYYKDYHGSYGFPTVIK
ncbi:hypothetical protein [Cetobacterium sp.]|uniref:hypothetical protein n=1 Tax=Cetobacterium sp. TaxID=2071632 RepID=UPI003F2F68E0